jgi:hypothetical protein
MQEGPEDGEEAQLLALFASDDYSSEDDKWLNDVGRAVQDAGFTIKALNDGLVDMDFSDIVPPEEEEEEEPAPAAKTKKAAAASPSSADEDEEATAAESAEYTREQLEEISLDRLKEIATERGITLPPRSRIQTYINAILGEEGLTKEAHEEHRRVMGGGPDEPVTEEVAEIVEISPAMLIVVYNGSVVARSITTEQAAQLISQPVS